MPASSSPTTVQLVALYRQALREAVPLEKIESTVERSWERTQVSQKREEKADEDALHSWRQALPRSVRWGALIIPGFLVAVGVFLLGNAVVPIAGYYVQELPEIQARQLAAPIPQEEVLDVMPTIITSSELSASASEPAPDASSAPLILDTQLDYTNLRNWFVGELPELESTTPVSDQTYSIDIPSLDIKNATVTVGGTNLNKSLIQFPGTALPGEAGAPVIFGHSVLRQFYNPSEKNPRRYNSIFSTIMTLKKGDKIVITRDNVTYTYIVQDKTEVKPTDTYILAQKYDTRALKLVTCTPEGTYLRRGVITAALVQ